MTLPPKLRFRFPRFGLPAWVVLGVGFTVPAQSQGLISPLHGYLLIEPFEVRQEYVFRFDTLADRLGEASTTSITAENRTKLETAIGEFLAGKSPVAIDGKAGPLELDRVHFVRPDPEKGLVVDERDSIPAVEALVGAVFAIAVAAPPQEVSVTWEVFPANGEPAIVEAGIRGQRVARRLTPEENQLTWKNEGGLVAPELLELPEVPEISEEGGWQLKMALLVGAFSIVLLGFSFCSRGARRRIAGFMAVGLGLVAIGLAIARPKAPALRVSAEEADEIVYALLRNIYHAFDYRRESDIYDVLAESAEGELLTRIYLEVSRSLEVESQGGARVRVTDLDLRKCELAESKPGEVPSIVTRCEWVAVGTVTHWGHTHDRVNRYRALLEIAPREQAWRLIDLELESEERIETGGPRARASGIPEPG